MPSRLPDPRLGDPTLDDWLGEQGEVDWSDDRGVGPSRDSTDGPTARAPAEGSEMTPAARSPARSSADARRLAVVRRRRAIGLAALLVLALAGVGLALTVFRGDEPTAPTTASVVATPPPSADPPAQPPAATTSPPEETPAPLTIELPASGPLALGARGEEVETLQAALAALQLDPGEADGFFGEATTEAVLAFQRANDLPADGIVGPSTVSKLNAALADAGVTG